MKRAVNIHFSMIGSHSHVNAKGVVTVKRHVHSFGVTVGLTIDEGQSTPSYEFRDYLIRRLQKKFAKPKLFDFGNMSLSQILDEIVTLVAAKHFNDVMVCVDEEKEGYGLELYLEKEELKPYREEGTKFVV